MTQSPGTWSYRPGTWLGIVGAASTLLLPAGEKRRAADLWSRIDDGDDFDTVLDALLQTGLGGLPAFVLIGTDAAAGTTRLLVRGDAVHASAQTADGTVEVEGPAGRTWVEQTLEGVTSLQVEVEPAEDGAGEVDDLTIVDGLVRVSRVGFPAGAGAGAATPAQEPAGATDAPGSTGPSWAAAAPVALPVAGDAEPGSGSGPDLPLVPSEPEPEPVAEEPSEPFPAAAFPPPPAYPPPAPAPASPSAWPTSSPGSAWPTPPPPPEPVSEPVSDADPAPTELLDLDLDDQPDEAPATPAAADALDPYPDEEPTSGFGGFAAFGSTGTDALTGTDTGTDTDPQAPVPGVLDEPAPAGDPEPAGVGFFGQAPSTPPADPPTDTLEPVRDDQDSQDSQDSQESAAPAWAAGLDLPPPPSPEVAAAQPAFEPEPAPPAPPAPPTPPPYGDHDGLTRAGVVSDDPGRPAVGIPGQSPAPGSLDEPVARLVLSHGENIDVDRVVLIGRAPEARRFTTTDQPLLVTVPSPLHEISSTHVEIRPGTGVDHGSAVVTDMGSTNGTVLVQPGLGPEDLVPGIAVQLIPGATINLGDGVTISVARP